MDVKEIPMEELLADREESIKDMVLCGKALSMGITKYPSGSISKRLEGNEKIVEVINKELSRRQTSMGEDVKKGGG